MYAAFAIALATDREVYLLGESVVLFGRGYGFEANSHLTFFLLIDDYSHNSSLHNEIYEALEIHAPSWDFTYTWHAPHAGVFVAYVLGPNHASSAQVTFQVLAAVPEFPLASFPLVLVVVILLVGFQKRSVRKHE